MAGWMDGGKSCSRIANGNQKCVNSASIFLQLESIFFQLKSVDNVTRQLVPASSSQLNEMLDLKTSFQELKNNWRKDLANVKNEKSKNNSSNFESNLEENLAEEKTNQKFAQKVEKIENEMKEKQKLFEDETRKQFSELKENISNAIFRNISADFAAKTDNGTDVMKSVYSLIHSLGEGLKRTSGKQRIDGGAITRFLLT